MEMIRSPGRAGDECDWLPEEIQGKGIVVPAWQAADRRRPGDRGRLAKWPRAAQVRGLCCRARTRDEQVQAADREDSPARRRGPPGRGYRRARPASPLGAAGSPWPAYNAT
jgi:hypothetical protein